MTNTDLLIYDGATVTVDGVSMGKLSGELVYEQEIDQEDIQFHGTGSSTRAVITKGVTGTLTINFAQFSEGLFELLYGATATTGSFTANANIGVQPTHSVVVTPVATDIPAKTYPLCVISSFSEPPLSQESAGQTIEVVFKVLVDSAGDFVDVSGLNQLPV